MSKTLLLALLLATAACNTIEGAGQDIKKAGEAVSDSAEKVRKKM
jgi:predicted small secreted protein